MMKRFISIIMVALLIAVMIPVAASAGSYSITLQCSKPGYLYTVYKVADYNSTTGTFTSNSANAAVTAQVTANQESTAALAAACAATDDLGSSVGTFNTTSKTSETFSSLDAGIYFIQLTTKSAKWQETTMESVVVFPNKENKASYSIDLAGKINEGEPKVSKWFLADGAETKADQTFGTTDKKIDGKDVKTITYVLKADVPGTADSKITSMVISDKMGTGLNTAVHSIESVQLVDGTGRVVKESVAKSVSTEASVIDRKAADTVDKAHGTEGNTFGVVIDPAELAEDDFYGEGYQIVVTYKTELLSTAPLATAIDNTDAMIYGNSATSFFVVEGNPVTLKTYTIKAYKEDATSGAKLGGATFTLYDKDKNVLATAVSAESTGEADFGILLPADTYYVAETAPPTGYNLNSTESTITLSDSTPNGIGTVTVKDTKAKMPQTGGTGTLVFTIVGGSLVLLAAALFIIVMKKRSSAK